MIRERQDEEPTLAPGIYNEEELSERATEEEIKNEEYTRVTHYDMMKTREYKRHMKEDISK
ncbi:hypothetical protein ACERII_07020 [Evansella sp. AB-rgal1]|uniref:hypothetical protein n=1 Tax=Evansella sp. AB-rgal1 TaxID=3242696 RepID=UPI00359EACDC